MSTVDAVKLLNDSLYRDRDNWIGENEASHVISLANCRCGAAAVCQCQNFIFTNFEAIAIAEKLLRDKK